MTINGGGVTLMRGFAQRRGMVTYLLALCGFDEDETARIEALLAQLQSVSGNRWQPGDLSSADLVLVDTDSVWGHMDWLRMQGSGRHLAACSHARPRHDDDLAIQSPVTVVALQALLARAESVIQPPSISASSASTPTSHHVSKPFRPLPFTDNRLLKDSNVTTAVPSTGDVKSAPVASITASSNTSLGSLLHRGKLSTAFQITLQNQYLTIDPNTEQFWTDAASLKPLVPLLALPLDRCTRPDTEKLEALRKTKGQRLARLKWFAALIQTPGVLPSGIGATTVLHMDRWPEIEREYPRHFRIATALMRQPGTVNQIAQRAKVDETDIIDFVRAYQAIGFVVQE